MNRKKLDLFCFKTPTKPKTPATVATGKAWIGTIKEASCKNILKN
jgi:hypothetical protein